MSRLFIAGLFHETHTFVEDVTGLDDFEVRRGNKILDCKGDSSPLGGALEFFQNEGIELVPGPDYRATPSGTVTDEVIECFWGDIVSFWNPNVDGIFLVLHGAMVSESLRDVEGEILARIRQLEGAADLPLYGVFDLHANFSGAMASNADLLVGYRENPHIDGREASVRAASLLADHLQNKTPRPTMLTGHSGLMWAPIHTATADDPMRSLEAAARKIEKENPDVICVSITAGFAYADTPDTGVSFQIASTNPDSATAHLDELNQLAHRFDASHFPADETPSVVMQRLLMEPVDGLTILAEPSDNIGGGAPGDSTGVLRAIFEYKIPNAAVCLNDPESVSALSGHQPGDKIELQLGGKGSRYDAGPIALTVELISQSDGIFELEDKKSHLASLTGDFFNMGPSAVVKSGDTTILLTSNRTPPFDLGQWRSQNLEPADFNVIVVKAAVAHRSTYEPVATRSFQIDTPGPCRSDLSQFDYHCTVNSSAEVD